MTIFQFLYVCNQMVYTFDVSDFNYLILQNSKFEMLKIYVRHQIISYNDYKIDFESSNQFLKFTNFT